MRKVIALTLSVMFAWSVCATAENFDLIAQSIVLNPSGGGGYADIGTNVGMLSTGTGPAYTSTVALELDGVIVSTVPLVTLPHEAPGCTYVPDYMGQPTCVDDPGCSFMTVNGTVVPGHCHYSGGSYFPINCGCWHDWYVLWPHVQVGGVQILRVIIDGANTVPEMIEENNITTLTSPVLIEPSTWGVIKSLYR